MPTRWTRALAGPIAAGSGLAAGHLVAGLIERNASPVLVVGNVAIDLAPEPVKQFAIRAFGEADKPVLLGGMAVVIALLAVLAGMLSPRGPVPGSVLIGAFGAVGVVAAATRPDLGPGGTVPALTATFCGVATFVFLHRTAPTAERAGRRRFLSVCAGVAGGAVASGIVGVRLARDAGDVPRALRERIPAPPPVPRGADFAAAGTPEFRTSTRAFYRVDTALAVPRVDARSWRLRVHGLVDRELDLDLRSLLNRPQVSRTVTMTCVSNEVGGPYVSTAVFTGVPIRTLLDEAGVRPEAQQVFSTSVDGYTAGTPLDVLLEADRTALLAYGMNGTPLPAEHGYPVRMVTAGLYGYVSATKWVEDLELTTFDRTTYWEKRGWAERAPIKPQSRIDRPAAFERVTAGRVIVAGTAWAQPHGVRAVEARVDGGVWRRATLSTEISPEAWRMWRITVDLSPGRHTVECRVTDRTGRTQTSRRAPTVPDGATGWHSVVCVAE